MNKLVLFCMIASVLASCNNQTSSELQTTTVKKGDYHGVAGTRKLLPPMPWLTYAKMTKEDILVIFDYLKSIKPVKNIVPAAIPPGS
jgi:hypothetical protein